MPRAPKPSRSVIERIRRRLEHLERQGIFDPNAKRRIVSEQEAKLWEKRIQQWSKATIERGGSLEFRGQLERMLNKIDKLIERAEKAKTSIKRRKIIEQLSLIQFPSEKVFRALPLETRMRIISGATAIIVFLEETAFNKRLPASERVAAIRALAKLYAHDAKILLNILERDPSNHAVRNEIGRILIKNPTQENIKLIKERLLERLNPDLKTFGIRTLAKMQNPLALTSLVQMLKIKERKPTSPRMSLDIIQREALLRGIIEQLRREKWRKSLRDLLGEIQGELTEAYITGGFHIMGRVFYTGLIARSIAEWVENFGAKVKIKRRTYEEIKGIIEEKIKEMNIVKKRYGINTDYAIANLNMARSFIEKLLGE